MAAISFLRRRTEREDQSDPPAPTSLRSQRLETLSDLA